MQEQLLTPNPEQPIVVHVVWFEVLAGDGPDAVDPSLMSDGRVRHYWDPDGAVSSFLLSHQRDIGFEAGGLLWDAYLLFEPQAVWEEAPAPLVGFGAPVVDALDHLTLELSELWRSLEDEAA